LLKKQFYGLLRARPLKKKHDSWPFKYQLPGCRPNMFLHELPDAKVLFQIISDERAISPSIVEKDYWVMHALMTLFLSFYVT